MKLRWIFLVAILGTVASGALGFGVALLVPADPEWLTFVATLSAMGLVLIPTLAGATAATLTFDPETPDGRKGFRRFLLVVVGVELLAIAGVVAVAAAVPTLAPYGVVAIVVSVTLLAVGLWLGGRIRRRTASAPEDAEPWVSWSRTVVRRKVTRIVLVFVLVTVITAVALVVLGLAFDGDGESLIGTIISSVSLGLISAGMACLIVSWPLGKDLRRALGNGYSEQKAINRVVLRGKDDELTEDGRRRSATYARMVASYLPFQIAQFAFLFGGVWLQQVANVAFAEGSGTSAVTRVLVVAYPVLVAIFLPLMFVQARRARRYAAAHAHLVPAEPDPSASVPAATAAGEAADRDVQPG